MNWETVVATQPTTISDIVCTVSKRLNDRIEDELERFIASNKKLSKNRDKFFSNASIERHPIGFMEFQEVYTWRKNVIMAVTFRAGGVTIKTYF